MKLGRRCCDIHLLIRAEEDTVYVFPALPFRLHKTLAKQFAFETIKNVALTSTIMFRRIASAPITFPLRTSKEAFTSFRPAIILLFTPQQAFGPSTPSATAVQWDMWMVKWNQLMPNTVTPLPNMVAFPSSLNTIFIVVVAVSSPSMQRYLTIPLPFDNREFGNETPAWDLTAKRTYKRKCIFNTVDYRPARYIGNICIKSICTNQGATV